MKFCLRCAVISAALAITVAVIVAQTRGWV